jgi:hypothetical protein
MFAAATVIVGTAVPSYAADDFIQGQPNNATSWATADFIPRASNIRLGAYACAGGSATAFLLELKKTSSAAVVYTAPRRAADTNWWWFDRTIANPNHAHYVKLYGQKTNAGGVWGRGRALCFGVSANW